MNANCGECKREVKKGRTCQDCGILYHRHCNTVSYGVSRVGRSWNCQTCKIEALQEQMESIKRELESRKLTVEIETSNLQIETKNRKLLKIETLLASAENFTS